MALGVARNGAWTNVILIWDPFTQTISKQGEIPPLSLQFGTPAAWAWGTAVKTSVRAAMVIMAMRIRVVFSEWVIFLRVLFLIEHKRLCLSAASKDICDF